MKGGVVSYRNLEVGAPAHVCCETASSEVARKPDEIKNSRRAATAPARNAVEIALLRRRGATHLSAQRRRRRCDTPCAKSFADALHCSRGAGAAAAAVCATSAWKCGMLHEHSRHAHTAQCEQNCRVSIAHFERQWSCRVGCSRVLLCGPISVFVCSVE